MCSQDSVAEAAEKIQSQRLSKNVHIVAVARNKKETIDTIQDPIAKHDNDTNNMLRLLARKIVRMEFDRSITIRPEVSGPDFNVVRSIKRGF